MRVKTSDLTRGLVNKYDFLTSFYTDFPPLGLWSDSFGEKEYIGALKEMVAKKEKTPLLLYLHFPYCPNQCTYCQCYQLLTHSPERIKEVLKHTYREIELFRKFFHDFGYKPLFKEIHLGGGSPSFLDTGDFDELVENLGKLVDFKELAEFTLEIDPRHVTQEKMVYYHKKGINRISFGVQDFDPEVQKAVNRIQPPQMIRELLVPEIRKFFRTVNFDIIYGLPRQTRESFCKTIDTVIELSPDRIALCVLGYRPDIFKHHRLIKKTDLPETHERTLINAQAMQQLMDNGYLRIGIDHFAKPEDDLGIALKNRGLHRSALGYTPGRCRDMLGVGPSSMHRINEYYFQNIYSLEDYAKTVEKGKLPIMRGYKLNADALARRDIMYEILCYFELDFGKIEEKHKIKFKEYFKNELQRLEEFVRDGIIEASDSGIKVTETGKFFLRHICTVFDNLGKQYKHSRETAKG